MKVGADHLYTVDGVEGGEGASSPIFLCALLQGIVEAERPVPHQLVTPAVPRGPALSAQRFFIRRSFCRNGEERRSLGSSQQLQGLRHN